jgi:azurin
MKSSHRLALLSIIAASAALTAFAENSTATAAAATTPAAATPRDTAAAQTVELTANDTMKFSQTEIKAKAGQSVTVTFKNVGTLPKTAMGHNFILLKSDDLAQGFIQDSLQAGETDYIPENHKDDIIAHTKLLGPGESESVTFTAPSKAGTYPYFCSFPGHYAVGMKGELVVE